jgi:hypothetical protein
MAAMLSAAVGPMVTASACADFGTGWTENRTIRRSTEQKNYLRNTDYFKVITSNLNLNERVRDSPVPWHCRAECQLVNFKAAMALRPCVQQRNLEDSSAARSFPAKFPVRPGAHGEVSRRKKATDFSREFLERNPVKILEKNPVKMEKNPVLLWTGSGLCERPLELDCRLPLSGRRGWTVDCSMCPALPLGELPGEIPLSFRKNRVCV